MKMLKFSSLFFSLFFLIACGGNSSKSNEDKIVEEIFPDDVINTIDENGRANFTQSQIDLHSYLKDASQGLQSKNLLSPEALLALFPNSIDGLDQFDEGGEISESLGAPATLTRIIYRKEKEVARVNLIDTGGHQGVLMGVASWALKALDTQNENYSEQTRTFRGFPAFQQWQPKVMQSRFEYVIDNRFVVSIQGKNIDMARVERVAKFLSPAKLRAAVK